MTQQELAAQANGLGDVSYLNPPNQGGFLRPVKQQMDSIEYDWEKRRKAYEVLKSQGDPAADTSEKLQDVRDYYATGVLPQQIQDLYTRQGREIPQPTVQQPQQTGLFRRVDDAQPQDVEHQTKPRWDYSKINFAPITTHDEADEKAHEERFNALGTKWASSVQAAKESKFTGQNTGSKGSVTEFERTGDLIPWMFKQVFDMNPDQIAKLPPATRREMMSDIIDLYHQSIGQAQWEAMGLGDVEKAKLDTYKKYGSDEAKDQDSLIGGFGTLFRSIGRGATNEVGNVLAFAEGEFGDGNADTGVGKAYKAVKAFGDWVGEDPENGELTAMKMRLVTLLQQDRLPEAVALVASNGELRMSIGGELLGQIGADAMAMAGLGAAAGTVVPGAGNVVGAEAGAALGAAKGLFSAGGKLYSFYKMAKAAAKAAPLQAVQSGGAMYADLIDRNIQINDEIKDLVHEAEFENALITAFTPGNLEGSVANIAGIIRSKVAAKGKKVAEEEITSAASELAKILASRGINASKGAIAKATPWARIKGVIGTPASYVKKSIPEAVQEGVTAYNEGATAMVQEDGTIRDLTEDEQANRVTQAAFEGVLGAAATAPRTYFDNRQTSQENQALSTAYQTAYKREKIEEDVKNQSEDFQTLYAQAEGTPEERFKAAQDAIAARGQAQQAMMGNDPNAPAPELKVKNTINESLAEITQQLADDGVDGLTVDYDPLHNYFVPERQRKTAMTARNTIMQSIDKAIAADAIAPEHMEQVTNVYHQVLRGDFSGLSVLNDEAILDGAQINKTNFKKALTNLSRLQPLAATETEHDVGVTRFTSGDRNKVAAQLASIQGNSTGIDATNLTGSIANVRMRLESARDGTVKQKGLERLRILESIVKHNLPENLDRINGYYQRATTNKRFNDKAANVFSGENGASLLSSTEANVNAILSDLSSQGVDSQTVARLKNQFKSTVRANPDVAFTKLKQELAALGNSVAAGEQNTTFLNPTRSTNAYLQHAYSRAIDAVNEVDNNLTAGAVRPVTPTSINQQAFTQDRTSDLQNQSKLGEMFDGIRFVLKGTSIRVPSKADLLKNPVGQLRQFQAALQEQPEISASGNDGVMMDIAQVRSYVNSVLDALVTGSDLPQPSDTMNYYAQQALHARQPDARDTVIPKPRNVDALTEMSYRPRPLAQSEQGQKLFSKKTTYDKLASKFEVVDTDSGPLIFLTGSDVSGKDLLDTEVKSGDPLNGVQQQAKDNVAAMVTSDKLDGGEAGKPDESIAEDVAVATMEEVNAQSVIKLISETDEDGRNVGLRKYVDKVINRKSRLGSQYQWQNSSLARAVSTLLNMADSPDSPINPPKITIRPEVTNSKGQRKLAMYVYHQSGGEIVLPANMTTDANVEDAVMHELLHWAISQQQLTYLRYSTSEAVNTLQDIYLDGLTSFSDLDMALRKAIATTSDADGKQLLQELHDILKLNNDSHDIEQVADLEEKDVIEGITGTVDALQAHIDEAQQEYLNAAFRRDDAITKRDELVRQLKGAGSKIESDAKQDLEAQIAQAEDEITLAKSDVANAIAKKQQLDKQLKTAQRNLEKREGEHNTLYKRRQRQISFEELMNFLMEKEATGELDTINKLIHTYVPGSLNPHDLISQVASGLANGIRKTSVKTHKDIFFNGRETFATAKKQPTIIRYGFKQGNKFVIGDPVAYLDPTTNSWSLHYYDTNGVPHLDTGMTFTQLGKTTQGMELWAGRIEKNRVIQKALAKMMSDLQRFSPSLYKFLSKINGLLRGTDDNIKAPVRQIANIIAGKGIRQQGITSWFKQIENTILNVAGVDVRDELESKYNEIRQQFQYELAENPVSNEKNIRSMMESIYTVMRDSGYPKEKIDNMLYALEAEDRHGRTLREHPIDPHTGKRRTNADNLTGFMLPNADNTDSDIDDSDGSKYRATWTAEEQLFANNLKQMYIELNNRVLEFEHMAGRMTDKQFNDLYGKFYMPLRNEDDGATAFAKRITGRRTKADSPMTHFQVNMMARLKSAEQSMIMQELMDTLAEHPVDGFVSFNSTTLTKTDEGRYQQRADGFVKGNTITFFRDGMKHTATVDDKIFAKALKAQRDSVEKDDMTQAYMKTMSGIVNMFARVRTQTPPFFVTSLFRDSAMTLINHQAAFRGKSGLTGFEHQALAVETVAFAAKNLANMVKWKANPDSADWRYKVYRKYGGIGHSEQFDLEGTRKQLGEDVFDQRKGFLGGVRKQGGKALGKWQDIMHASDDLLRFSTWLKFVEKKAGRKFSSEADLKSYLVNNPDISRLATDGSKNITGNFQNKGMGNQFERAHFIFWNAAMTGINTALRVLNPRYGMQGIGAAGTLFSLMFLQGLSAPDDDEDGKSKFFRIKGIGDGLTIGGIEGVMYTMPQEMQPLSHLAIGASGLITGNYTVGEAAKHVMTGFLKGYTPFTPAETGNSLLDVMYAFVPTIFQPMALRAAGVNFYGGDAVPKAYDADGKEMPDAPNAARVRNSDSGWAVQMAHAAYSATDGIVDMSPGAVEEIPKQVLGGVYSMFNNYFTEYGKNGGDAIGAAASSLFKGKTVEYNEFKLREDIDNRFDRLKTKFRAGEQFNDMFRGKDDLPPEYHEVEDLQKQMKKELDALKDDGESVSTINNRIKQLRLDPTSPQELFELQTRAANIYAQRNYIYGKYMQMLDELGLD